MSEELNPSAEADVNVEQPAEEGNVEEAQAEEKAE